MACMSINICGERMDSGAGKGTKMKNFLVYKNNDEKKKRNNDEKIYGWRRVLLKKLTTSWNLANIVLFLKENCVLSFWLSFFLGMIVVLCTCIFLNLSTTLSMCICAIFLALIS